MIDHEDYPPINRKPSEDLGAAYSRIVGADKTLTLDANALVVAAYEDKLDLGKPVERTSDLSHHKGFVYQTVELEMVLTKNELLRLIRRDLKPEEFKVLRDLYGIFFEIHDDFYDPFTGVALQPV